VTICFDGPYFVEPKPSLTQTATSGQPFSITFYFKDTDSTPPLNVTAEPNWFTISTQANDSNHTEAILSFTPNNNHAGTNTITVTATDGVCEKEVDFSLTVTAVAVPGGGGGGAAPEEEEKKAGCVQDSDCPSGMICDRGRCLPPPSELEELPEPVIELPREERPAGEVVPPAEEPLFITNVFGRIPFTGEVEAMRLDLETDEVINWPMLNIHKPLETPLGKNLRMASKPLQSIFYPLLLFLFALALFLLIRKGKPPEEEVILEQPVSY